MPDGPQLATALDEERKHHHHEAGCCFRVVTALSVARLSSCPGVLDRVLRDRLLRRPEVAEGGSHPVASPADDLVTLCADGKRSATLQITRNRPGQRRGLDHPQVSSGS